MTRLLTTFLFLASSIVAEEIKPYHKAILALTTAFWDSTLEDNAAIAIHD